jgi:hypothetical protein
MITEELKQRLQIETPRIRALARLRGDEAFFTHKTTSIASPLGELPFRLETAEKQEIRIEKTWIKAQAEVAAIHGLGYLKDGKENRWVDLDDSNLTPEEKQYIEPAGKGKRADTYLNGRLQQIRDLNKGIGLKTSMRQVDLALFAHTCQLPIDTFLLAFEDDKMNMHFFNQSITLTRKGKNLFAQDAGFLDQFSNAARGSIRIAPLEPEEKLPQNDIHAAAEAVVNPVNANPRPGQAAPGMRAIVVLEAPLKPSGIRSGAAVSITITPPEDYQKGCELLALEKDSAGNVMLISSAMNLDDTTRFTEEEFVIPRLIKQMENHKPAKMAFNCKGHSRVYVLMLKLDPKADTVLQTLPSFRRTTVEAYNRNRQAFDTRFDEEDFAELRKILLQRDRSSWLCLHHDLQILPANP